MDVRVLCVDDDPELLALTAEQLRRRLGDVAVDTAADAAAAREVLASRDVDCVVSDYEMPETTGLDLLRELKADQPDLPFVLFTGRGSESVASEAISAGVTDYLQKGGVEQYELLANSVERAVEGYRLETELQETNRTLELLTESAVDVAAADDGEHIIERTLDVAEDILSFDVVGIYEFADGEFVPRTDRSFRPADGLRSAGEGIIGRTYAEGESYLIDDVTAHDDADPASASFRSALSVPMGEFGVFQAVSQDPESFTEKDLEMAELLVAHTAQALDRVVYEQDLRETNEQFQAILDNTTALIYVKDLDGRYTLVNRRYVEELDADEDDILGRTDHELQAEEYAAAVRENDWKAIEEERAVEAEERAFRDGEERTYYSVKVPIFDEDGNAAGVCGISSDITELKERERELKQQKERLDEFASVVSHDLRNPLSVADGYLELVRGDVDDDRLDQVATALDRMHDILDDLLTLARDGQDIGETEAVRVGDLAEEAWGNVSTDGMVLAVEDDLTVEADPTRLLQVFENCFRNSVEHALDEDGEGASRVEVGTLSLEGDEEDRRRRSASPGFYVADDGDGFPPGVTERAFTPGFTTSDDGTGFGLAIVKRIVEAHGWSVRLRNGQEGGACVEVQTD
jgi:PAS domain S-box-containing protein